MTDRDIVTVFVAAFGLVVGSYLNVVIHRLPRGRSTVGPRSGCPYCGSLIRWWDNLPLLSFLWLGGRCRDCRSPISWRYPLVELLGGAGFVLCFRLFGPSWNWLIGAFLVSLLLLLAFIDLEHMILPDRLTLPGAFLGLALHRWIPWREPLRDHLVGLVLGPVLLLSLYGLWYLVRRTEGLGLGDVKMMALIGAFLGWRGSLASLLVGTTAALSVAVVQMVRGRLELRSKMPFGPFLALGALAALAAAGSGWLQRLLPPLPWG